jgi:thiamine pyrophosphokinase
MNRRPVFVVAGGDLERSDLDLLRQANAWIVAADGGAKKLVVEGIIPHMAVGDFDTAGADFADELVKLGSEVHRLPAEKAETDTHFALGKALEKNPDEVVILGALGGGRTDHLLGNIGLLEWLDSRSVKGTILNARNRIRLVSGPGQLELVKSRFTYVSLIPVSSQVDGIRTSGLKYPLNGETLTRGLTRGISNEIAAEHAAVTIAAGKLLVVESRD